MSNTLTVGMAVYREFESVWATIQGLRANHGDGFDLVIVDNAPDPCVRTRHVTAAAGGSYYHRPDLAGTSKPRDACFQFARTPWVLVCDSHVAFENGAIDAAVRYADAHPDSRDVISGPIVGDNGRWTSTQWNQPHPPGLWGTWDTHPDLVRVWNPDEFARRGGAAVRRAADAVAPFEIHSMGLGCYMMRRAAWVGFNPLFRGFGGEEGYTHEKVRQLGGRALCLPPLRWRHRFRDTVDWKHSPQPYPSSNEDHVFNMIVGHLELGIDPAVIREHFGKKLAPETWAGLEALGRQAQPFGQLYRPKRMRLLGVWYTNNAAPEALLGHSLATIKAAAEQSRHVVEVVTCPHRPVAGNPFREVLADLKGKAGHAAIVQQIDQCIGARDYMRATSSRGDAGYDAVVYLEHDVLYPPGYFDLMGDAFAKHPGAAVVVNHDYEGLNATGWLKVRERHEPMHQIAMSWNKALQNHARTKAEAEAGQCFLEPDSLPGGGPGDRSGWVRLPARGFAPAVHVNHAHRFTSHGDVVYHQDSGGRTVHPFWGEHKNFWPAAVVPAATVAAPGCGSCGQVTADSGFQPATLEDYYEVVRAKPSDFHEHVPTLRELADGCDVVAEISGWDDKPAVVALAASKAKKVYSYAAAPKTRVWSHLKRLAPDRFEPVQWWQDYKGRTDTFNGEPIPDTIKPCDLLFIDTRHNAESLWPLLDAHHKDVRRYIVIHCTEIYGTNGDDGKVGVMPAVRGFLDRNRRWTVIRQDRNNYGLVVLSCDERDKGTPPGVLRKALNFSMALAAHAQNGAKLVTGERWELRMAECLTCPHRVHDACALCGCPVDKKTSWDSEACPDKPPRWPASPAAE